MKIPLGWLRELVPTDLPADELAELMARRIKVEGLLDPWAGLDGVVAARVIEVRDHPDSDTLCVARIQHGAGEAELVVGVRNMAPGDLVPWAPPGARVPALEEPLGTRRLRGVESHGMLCSPRELGLSTDHSGILVIDEPGWDVGADVKAALELDQPVLDVEVEPNRPDLLSILGVAREVAIATGVQLREPPSGVGEAGEGADGVASVRLDAPDGCPRYVARVIRGVAHGASPLLAQGRLTACGMRPIDSVVDATNYAMLELGQPLHGFDLTTLVGPGIVVRRAQEGERLTTLDDVERTLTADDLLICDLERPVALAGIMGGLTSEVTATTTDVLLESAYFTRGGVLLTARRLDLHSEASHRFERGTDPEGLDRAAARGAALISAWAGGSVLRGAAAAGETPARHWVSIRPARASALLGYAVEPADVRGVFDALGFAHRDNGGALAVEVPGYRTDIDREVDLIEEVVRIQGYDRVGSTHPRAPLAGGVPPRYAFARRAKDALVRAGLQEIRPGPFVAREDLELFGDEDAIGIANPLRAEEGYLRTRLTPGLLHAVARNRDRGVDRAAVFEVGMTFRLDDPFVEVPKAGWALHGPAESGWFADGRTYDALDAKGVLGSLLLELGVGEWSLGDPPRGPFHPGRSAEVVIGGRSAGVLGEIHPRLMRALGVDGRIAVGVIGLRAAMAGAAQGFTLRDVPRFPPVRRDLAFIVPDDAPAEDVRRTIVESGGDLLGSCEIFDVFRGGAIPPGHTSLAFALAFRAPERTLTDDEVQPSVDAIVDAVAARFDGQLRAG